MLVLIVDDSLAIRERLAAVIDELAETTTYEVCLAMGADEALAAARQRRPDVVLLDLHLPGRGGLSVLRELTALSPRPLVVVLTNDPTEQHRRSCVRAGADFFVDKAADVAALLAAVLCPTAR